MKVKDITDILEKRSPLDAAEDWDIENVGLQVGDGLRDVSKIYLALDATEEVIEDALYQGADMIITHHPMIFGGVRKINTDTSLGRRILTLAENRIAYYAMHTNYDVYGMAHRAGEILGLKEPKVFFETAVDKNNQPVGIGRYGHLQKRMSLEELSRFVKERFDIESVRYFGSPDAFIETAAISPGAGKSMIRTALSVGVDVIITGDIDHHTGIDAVADGLYVIDAGHYGIEHIFTEEIYEYLLKELSDKGGTIDLIKEPIHSPFHVI